MGKYEKMHQCQLSKNIVNNNIKNKQLKQIIDNRLLFVKQMKLAASFPLKREGVLQRNANLYKKPIMKGGPDHYQIGFDSDKKFAVPIHVYQPEEMSASPNPTLTYNSKDVGFGAQGGLSGIIGGKGELFTYSNGIEGVGGTKDVPISNSSYEDDVLVSVIDYKGPFDTYNILTRNCRHWYNTIVDIFNQAVYPDLTK